MRKATSVKGVFSLCLLSACYALSSLTILSFPGAIFWDDWTLFGTPKSEILHHFSQMGFPHYGYINVLITNLGPGTARVIVFGLGIIGVVLWFRVLELTPGINRNSLLFSTGAVASFPFFLARVAAMNAGTLIAMAIFLLGWLLFLHGEESAKRRVATSGLGLIFFAGALHNAYIPLLVVAFLHAALISSMQRRPVLWKTHFLRIVILLSLHVMVLVLQRQFFPPSGSYTGYRSIVLGPGQFLLLLVGLSAISVFIFRITRSASFTRQEKHNRTIDFLLLGFLGYLLAISPYVLIGSFPPYGEWKTRYELNYFIPATIFLMVGFDYLEALVGTRFKKIVGIILVLSSVVYSNFMLSRFFVDWQKHSLIAEELAQNPQIRGKFVVFIDETENLNAMKRTLRPYEWSGILSDALGSRDTFGIGAQDFNSGFARYIDGELTADLNSTFNYRWRNHSYPSDGVLVSIRTIDQESCGLLQFSVQNCLAVEVNSDLLVD